MILFVVTPFVVFHIAGAQFVVFFDVVVVRFVVVFDVLLR